MDPYPYVFATCADRRYHVYISPEGDHTTIIFCPDRNHVMAKSTSKTVLFATGKDGKVTRQWPVAVFNNDPDAKSYATILRLAYRAGDQEGVTALDPAVRTTEAGALLADVKFSVTSLPYAPVPELPEDETAVEETPSS